MAAPAAAPPPVLLILGAGPGIGSHVAAHFAHHGYRVALAARSPLRASPHFTIQADFDDPSCISSVFAAVEAELGVPSVVVYNAASYNATPPTDPFALPLAAFTASLRVNTASVYAAAQDAVRGFATLPAAATKTFILTGNCLNIKPMPALCDLGAGKAAGAHIVEVGALAYGGRGYHFYYADERTAEGKSVGTDVSGKAAAEFYYELAGKREQGPWEATFVGGVGYVEFDGRNVL